MRATTLQNHLANMTTQLLAARQRPAGFTYGSLEEFLLAHGRDWPVAVRQQCPPFGVIYPRACFENAFRLASRHPQYRYVEGVALGPGVPIPVHHAWCLNVDDEVVDPTWGQRGQRGTEYFGVVIPLDVAANIRHPENHSILLNWQRGFPLFREPWRQAVGGV